MNTIKSRLSFHVVAVIAVIAGVASANGQTLSITNGLTWWLKADAISGLTNGQAVSLWEDSSTNGYDATQAIAGERPTYMTGILNGLPVVRFDDPGSVGPAGDGDQLTTTSIGALADMSLFLVAKPVDVLSRYALTFGGDTRALVYGFANTTHWTWFNGSFTNLAAFNVTKFQVVSYTGANTLTGSWAVGGNMGGGNTNPFKGDIAEVIVFDRALSITERQEVTEYLIGKWAIPEPSSVALLGLGGVILLRRRQGNC